MSNAAVVFRLEMTSLQKWASMLAPESFQRHVRNNIPRATGQNGAMAAAAMRKAIQGAKFVKNAALTIAIKGSSKPLVDHGDLFKAITHKKIDDWTAFAGMLRSTGDDYNLAELLHEGVSIEVTPAMRGMFFSLWKASKGELDTSKLTGRAAELFARMSTGWAPLKPETSHIVIPGRPWSETVIKDDDLKRRMQENWQRALGFVFRDMKREFFGR